MPFGGVKGEGCKDVGRWLRQTTKPAMTLKEFEDFLFTTPATIPIVTDLLKSFIRAGSGQGVEDEPKCVFTHGDPRTANIRVVRDEDGKWKASGIIDW
jgi:hypothetical protein